MPRPSVPLPLAALALTACEAAAPPPDVVAVPRAWDSPVPLRGADRLQIRGETRLGCRNEAHGPRTWTQSQACAEVDEFDVIDPLTDTERYAILWKDTDGFVPVPRMKTKFQVDDGTEPLVAVTFSAMAHASEQDAGAARVRVRIDGQEVADPGPVTFWSNRPEPHRWAPTAFTFLVEAGPGVHTVEVQYESSGSTILLRDASLRVDVERWTPGASPNFPYTREGLFAESSTPDLATLLPQAWKRVPGGGLDFSTGAGHSALLVLSPTLGSEGGEFAVRAVVDGVVAAPSQFVFDGRQELAARGVAFVVPSPLAGDHHVDWEWRSTTSTAATVELEALTELAVVGPRDDPDDAVRTQRQSSAMTLTEADNFKVDDEGWHTPVDPYRPIPGLQTTVDLDEISDAAITVTAQLAGDRVVFVAPTLDGAVLRDQEVLFAAEAARNDGPRTYTFALKDIPAGADTVLGLAARSASGDPLGQSLLTSAAAGFRVKRRVGPDLAVGPRVGAGSMLREAILEPVVGPRRVLAIALDTGRSDAVVPDKPDFEALLAQSLDGGNPSVAGYLDAMSSGLAGLTLVAPPRLYAGDHPGGDGETNYYWDPDRHDCDDGATYNSPHAARWAAALRAADADGVDFAGFDDDRDDVLEAHELGLILYSVDDGTDGSSVVTRWSPRCDGQPFELDGVRIREFSNVSVPSDSDIGVGTKTVIVAVTMHELGHLLLGLDDQNFTVQGSFDPADGTYSPDCGGSPCEVRRMNTDPFRLSMMSVVSETALPHLTAFEKLHLGWATPRIPADGGPVSLRDVAESKDAVILPRRDSDAKEYFLLEARFPEPWGSDKYDQAFGTEDGLAAYHVVEPSPHCFAGDPASCRPLTPPPCVPDEVWALPDGHARASLRLVNEHLTHSDGEVHLLNVGDDLLDEAPGGGLSCPVPKQIGVAGGAGHLVWSGDLPSGYRLLGVDSARPVVDFDLVVP